MTASLDQRTPKRWLILTAFLVGVVAVAGLVAYLSYEQMQPGCFACASIPYPAIQNAYSHVGSLGPTNCQLSPTDAVCPVFINAGDSGNVTLNVIDQNQGPGQGGSRAQFLVYSSDARFINFTSMPSCAYTLAPTFNAPSCMIGGQTLTFQFSFIVSSSYVSPPSSVAREPASITIVIYKTCCWP